jgi:hypothetical protein
VGLRHLLLVLLGGLACAAGSSRETHGTSLSIGDTTGGTVTEGTASSGASDPSVSTTTVGTDDGTASTNADSTGEVDASSDGGSTGAPQSCADDVAACDAWFLPRGASAWEAVTIGGPAALAPNGSVLAAFDIEADHVAFLITADELVRVDLDGRSWISKTSLGDTLPEINVDVFGAYSIPAYQGGMPGAPESITITGSDVAFLYNYAAGTFTFDQSTVFGDEWNGPAAPAKSSVREMWLDLTNDDGWVGNDVSEICAASGPVGPYVGVVTDAQVYIEDAGYCFDFFPAVDYSAFGPFGLPAAPPVDRMGGIAYNETTGLVVFASD